MQKLKNIKLLYIIDVVQSLGDINDEIKKMVDKSCFKKKNRIYNFDNRNSFTFFSSNIIEKISPRGNNSDVAYQFCYSKIDEKETNECYVQDKKNTKEVTTMDKQKIIYTQTKKYIVVDDKLISTSNLNNEDMNGKILTLKELNKTGLTKDFLKKNLNETIKKERFSKRR